MRAGNGGGDVVRAAICRYVRSSPGAHFRDIQRALSLSPGQAVHHLRVLVSDGLVVERRVARYTHYFPAGTPAATRAVLATLRHPLRNRLVETVREQGPVTMQELTTTARCASSTLHYHLKVLVRAEVLTTLPGRPAKYELGPAATPRGAMRLPTAESE